MSTPPAGDKMDSSGKMMKARCRLFTCCPFYGHMAISMNWVESEMNWVKNPDQRTLGTKIESNGSITCYFNPEWSEKQSVEVLYGAIEHVINHLVYLHAIRTNMKEVEPWHMACDMVVNGHKANPHIGHKRNKVLTLPDDNMIFVPTEWKDTETADWYYARLLEEMKKQQGQNQPSKDGEEGEEDENGQKKKGKGKGKSKEKEDGDEEDGEGGEGEGGEGEGEEGAEGEGGEGEGEGESEGKGRSHQIGKHKGNSIDDHSTWQQSEISQDEARQIVNSMVKDAVQKSQGSVPGHLQEAVEALGKAKVNWKALLRQYIARHCGNKRKTYSRTERRLQAFGSKGISRHAASTIQVVIDTSGSVSQKELEQFFGEIEACMSHSHVNVLQYDAGPCGWFKYRKGGYKVIGANGRGGTDMAAAMKHAVDNYPADAYVLLTDGYTGWPENLGVPWICCITQPEKNAPSPNWGHVIRIEMD